MEEGERARMRFGGTVVEGEAGAGTREAERVGGESPGCRTGGGVDGGRIAHQITQTESADDG